jgi:hypothetical protein
MTMSNPVDQAFEQHGYTEDGAVAAMLAKWGVTEDEDGESPSDSEGTSNEAEKDGASHKDESSQDGGDAKESTTDEDDEDADESDESDDSDDSDEDSDDEDKGEDEQEQPSVSDDAKITVEVNGESKEFTVGDLKRLAGQEAALTQKSQEVANQRKTLEAGLTAQRTALETMVERAIKRFEPYKDFDFVLAAKQYDAETYKALKEDAQSAYSDLEFYRSELKTLVEKQDTERQQALQEQAREAIKILRDPEKGIPGFSRTMYTELRDYAIDIGISEEDVDQLVHPSAWKMIHKAMQFDKLQKAKDTAVPVKRKAKQTVKTRKAETSSHARSARSTTDALRGISSKSGLESIEAAAEAIAARWK